MIGSRRSRPRPAAGSTAAAAGAPASALRYALGTALVLALLASHCSGGDDAPPLPSASFESSGTPRAPDLLRLSEHSRSGDTVTLDVELTGRTTSSDIYGIAFSIFVEDTNVAKLLANSAAAGPALSGEGCEGISALAGQAENWISVGATKLGICPGNGIPEGETRVVLRLVIRAVGTGVAALRIEMEDPARAPTVIDSNGDPISSVVFDQEPAYVIGQ